MMKKRMMVVGALAGALLAANGGDEEEACAPQSTWMGFERLTLPEGTLPLVSALPVPGTEDEMLLLEILGVVRHVRIEGNTVSELGSFTISLEDRCSLLSGAFDPDWETNRFLYIGLCANDTGSEIVRYTFDPPSYDAVVASEQRIYLVDEPLATRPWHQVGSIGFFEDGSMWALFGEQLRSANAQDTTNELGKILRIVPSRDPATGGATPHPDNPFFGHAVNSPNIWAWGVRSPFRGALDASGRLWVGDVGENTWEEINIVPGIDAPGFEGVNLGWPTYEGRCTGLDCANFVQPLVYWQHADDCFVLQDEETELTTKRLAYVGLQYQPRATDRYEGRLEGRMIYGDMCAGWVRSVRADSTTTPLEDRLDGHRPYISQWIQGADDHLYVTTLGECEDPSRAVEPPGLWRVVVRD